MCSCPRSSQTRVRIAIFQFEHGHADLGWTELKRARALDPDDPSMLADFAIASAVGGDRDEARRLLGQLEAVSARRYVSPVVRAFVHATLDERDSAFALLAEACAARDPLLIPIQVGETEAGVYLPADRATSLRSDPRFRLLIERMGLVRSLPAVGRRGSRPRSFQHLTLQN